VRHRALSPRPDQPPRFRRQPARAQSAGTRLSPETRDGLSRGKLHPRRLPPPPFSRPLMNLLTSRRFLPLFVVQFIGAFCDNVFKNAFVLLATFGLAQAH